MAQLQPHQIRALLAHVTAHAPALLATCRWLLVDPRLALLLGDDARPPATADLARFLRLLRDAPAEAAATGHALLAARSRLAAELDLALERLLAAAEDDWTHPTEILGRPCPGFAELHAASLDRLESRNGDRRRLESVRDKLARAARLEATARRGLRSPPLKKGG